MPYIPDWFKTYVRKEGKPKNMILLFLAVIATGITAFGGFPDPPPLMKTFFENPKNQFVKWILVWLLIWQGRFGTISPHAISQSLIGTIVIYVIYHSAWFQNRLEVDKKSEKYF